MVCAARLSERVCGLPGIDTARISDLVAAAGLPIAPPKLAQDRWLELMRRDKKTQDGVMRFVLLERLGRAIVRSDVSDADVFGSIAG